MTKQNIYIKIVFKKTIAVSKVSNATFQLKSEAVD